MKKTIFLSALILTLNTAFSQIPGIKWQRALGDINYDSPKFTVKTNDNGIIIVGYLTENTGGSSIYGPTNLWVEKFNDQGISQWRKILGGSGSEDVTSYVYNVDGSIVILANTFSTDGDITNSHGAGEAWIIKLDNNGNVVWSKVYGGSNGDGGTHIIKATGGGYIFSGGTNSNDGDVTGFHGGESDVWVVKINEAGGIVWQRTLGGSGIDGTDEDNQVYDLAETADGSIIICTETYSNDGDVVGHHGPVGADDIWLVKLSAAGAITWSTCVGGIDDDFGASCKVAPSGDIYVLGMTFSAELPSYHPGDEDLYFCRVSSSGTLLFQKCFGGSSMDFSRAITSIGSDGSCVIGGEVASNDGDVVGHHGAPANNFDIWVLKIDLTGNIIWQKTLGGSKDESFLDEYEEGITPGGSMNIGISAGTLIPTSDGGILFSSLTRSNDGDVSGFHPISAIDPNGGDIWVVKLSGSGQLEWQRALGGARGDIPRPPLEFGINDYIILGASCSRDGDLQENQGAWDPWIVRFGAVNRIKGIVFVDQNGNGVKDVGDSLFSDATIKAVKGSDTRSVIPYHGSFVIDIDTGSYNTTLTPFYPYYTVLPASHSSSYSSYFNTDSFSFALQPLANIKDLVISAIPTSVARPGFPLSYILYYKNAGVVPVANAEVKFAKDPRLIIQSAQPLPSVTVGDTLKWSLGNLDPQASGIIRVNMTIAPPPASNVGDTLLSFAIIDPVAGDITPSDDTSKISQRIQGSYDPNDKAENLGGSITKERVVAGDYITYFIRFQNTGTDTAFNVVVRDTLDSKLDWNSFQMIASSHSYTLQIDDQDKLIWTFYGINLPDSNVNEPASHGYIAYRVKADNTLNIGATIFNRASIYFDFNLPVNTNFAPMIVGTPIALPLKLLDFDARYQQPDAELKWTTAEEFNVDKFIIERGVDPIHYIPVGTVHAKGGNASGKTQYQFQDKLANVNGDKFYYRLKMVDQDNKFTFSNIALVKRNGNVRNEVAVNPNPTRSGFIMANINFNKNVQAVLSITDMQGRVLNTRQQNLGKGYNVISLSDLRLPAGTYFLQVKTEGKQMVTSFVISQ